MRREFADKRIFPAIDVEASSTRREELLMARDELAIIWKLRRLLSGLEGQQGLELGLADVPAEHVDLAAVAWEIGRDLIADEDVREVRDLERSLNAVVIGDRHELVLGKLKKTQSNVEFLMEINKTMPGGVNNGDD